MVSYKYKDIIKASWVYIIIFFLIGSLHTMWCVELLSKNTRENPEKTTDINDAKYSPFCVKSENDPDKNEMTEHKQKFPFSELSFHSSGWMNCFQYGVSKYIQDNYDISECKMIGTSAGALVACTLCCDIPIEKIYNEINKFRKISGNPFFMCHYAKQSIHTFLPDNCIELINDRLTIVCSGLEKNGFVPKKYNHFTTKQGISQYLNATIHIPVIDGILPDMVGGDLLYDGVFVDSHPQLSGSISSSCLKITWDKTCYCGCTKTQNTIFPEMEFPFYWIGLPPDDRCLSLLYYHGYYCAKTFFSKKNDEKMTDMDVEKSQNIILELNAIIRKTNQNYITIQNRTYLFKGCFLFLSCLYLSQYITTFIPNFFV
jgi:hypothetical protein